MAITYLSGQRVQGVGVISGYKDWTTSGSGWSETTSGGKNIVKATNPGYTSTFHGSVYELPETVSSTFLLRWTVKVTSVTAYSSGSHQFVAWLGGLTIDGSDTAMNQTGGVGLNYGTNPTISWGGSASTGELGGGVGAANTFGTVSATTTKYMEVVGTDTSDYEVRMYSNSDYSDTPTTKSYTNSGFTGSNALKFIRFSGGSTSDGSAATGNITAEFSDVKFWNSQTTSSGDPDVQGFADTPSDKSTITNVPVGSEFEQTDNYKTYQRFSSTGNTYTWTDCGSDNQMTITNGVQSTGAWIRAGTLIGTKITKITQKMYRVGDASGDLICHQINSGDTGAIKATSSTVAISGLTVSTLYGSATSVDFDFATPVEIAVNDCFIVSSDGSPCKLWSDGGNCDSNNTNWMESNDQSPPTFTEMTAYTARGSATYNESGWRERGTAI